VGWRVLGPSRLALVRVDSRSAAFGPTLGIRDNGPPRCQIFANLIRCRSQNPT
jgi:hypothetical protein